MASLSPSRHTPEIVNSVMRNGRIPSTADSHAPQSPIHDTCQPTRFGRITSWLSDDPSTRGRPPKLGGEDVPRQNAPCSGLNHWNRARGEDYVDTLAERVVPSRTRLRGKARHVPSGSILTSVRVLRSDIDDELPQSQPIEPTSSSSLRSLRSCNEVVLSETPWLLTLGMDAGRYFSGIPPCACSVSTRVQRRRS
jgi:hypothetical protein